MITTKKIRVWNIQRFFLGNKKSIVYKGNKTGNKAEPCLIPISTLKKGEEKLFQRYFIFLPEDNLGKI